MTYERARAELILFCGIDEPTEEQIREYIVLNGVEEWQKITE